MGGGLGEGGLGNRQVSDDGRGGAMRGNKEEEEVARRQTAACACVVSV